MPIPGSVANLPVIGPWLTMREQNQTDVPGQQLQQMAQFQTIQNSMQQSQERQMAAQRDAQMRSVLQGLPPNATQEQVAASVRPFAGANQLLTSATASADRQSALEAAKINRAEGRDQRTFELEERGRQKLGEIREQAAQGRITKEEADARARETRLEVVRAIAANKPERQERRHPVVGVDPVTGNQTINWASPDQGPQTFNTKPPSVTASGNNQAMRLRTEYNSNPEVKLANSLEPRIGTAADYVASVGKGMGNSVGDAELVKLWLMTTHPKGDQISNMDYGQIAKMPDLMGRVGNIAGNFVFGKTLDGPTRNSMWKSVSEKYKATDGMRANVKKDIESRGRAMNLNAEAIFSTPAE